MFQAPVNDYQGGARLGACRGYPPITRLNPAEFEGTWSGFIRGRRGNAPSGDVAKRHKHLLWRFNACIPYLAPFATHDEVIAAIWPEAGKLIDSAAAAKEKRFGQGENWVLPQYVELTRSRE